MPIEYALIFPPEPNDRILSYNDLGSSSRPCWSVCISFGRIASIKQGKTMWNNAKNLKKGKLSERKSERAGEQIGLDSAIDKNLKLFC